MQKLAVSFAALSLLLFAVLPALAGPASSKPAVLVCNPSGTGMYYGDATYLAELHDRGFEIDRIDTPLDAPETLINLNWERIKNYNVLVIFRTPDASHVAQGGSATSDPKRAEDFVHLIEKYLDAGGGVFLMPDEENVNKQRVSDLTDGWGAKLPAEILEETDPAKIGAFSHQTLPAAFTDQVLPSPVSDEVKQIWYPVMRSHNAQLTSPLWVDTNPPPGGAGWQVVVKASKTAKTKPVNLAASGFPAPPNLLVRPGGEAEPPLFAIRALKQGRVALTALWPQYSFWSGTKWAFNREVLSAGLNGQRSDFGRLIENTLHWLAEPSLKTGALGGYVMPAGALLAPNYRPGAKKDFEYLYWHYEPEKLGYRHPPENGTIFRGLIGAKSAYSSGRGTVAEYAQAAKEAGLDFLVFLEDYGKISAKSFEQLKADCDKQSTPTLLLLAGLALRNNVGDHIFCFGSKPSYPLEKFRTGANHDEVAIQEVNDKGQYTGWMAKGLDFLNWVMGHYMDFDNVLGFYNYSGNPHGLRVATQRDASSAGIFYYKNGQLVEDVTADYLKSAQSGLSPAPVAINEVASPDELKREVASGHALTYAQARSLATLMLDALRFSHGGDGMNVFPSSGPIIRAWPTCKRVMTFGAEEFVTGAALNPMPLNVTSDKGLKELRIYDGEHLFRRFVCSGAKEFNQTLVLDGSVQRALVLIAEDIAGGKAVSFASFSRFEGSMAPVYCGDHFNDGGYNLIAHGWFTLQLLRMPLLPTSVAGESWDGGPNGGGVPLLSSEILPPYLESDRGVENSRRFEQDPVLEYSDQGAVAVARFHNDRVFADNVLQIVDFYQTWGPLAGPSKLFACNTRYQEVLTPTIGANPSGWAAQAIRTGVNAALFRHEITFKEEQTIRSLQLAVVGPSTASALFVVGDGSGVFTGIEMSRPSSVHRFPVKHGEWFGYYSANVTASYLFINRGETILLENRETSIHIFADVAGRKVKKGDRYDFSLAGFGFPVNFKVNNPGDFLRYLSYLKEPTGLEIKRGKRVDAPGFVELTPDNYAVELSVPKPVQRLDLSLPVRVRGLNPRWTAGLFQKTGYVKGDYGTGENRFRTLGLDLDGTAFFPLFVDYAPNTHMVAGHPIVAGPEGKDLFIQVTKVRDNPDQWHVSVNNPGDAVVTTQLSRAMELPGLKLATQSVTLQPGEYRIFE